VSEEGVERRLTTILAADVVGYSRLMAADEAGTLTSLKALRRELIEPKTVEYHGRVVKLMGDGTLMEFGSVVDAIQFAVDVQRAMVLRNTDVPENQRIIYRIGINIGDIIVEGDDIYGDGVNIAARLEGLAEPGGICVARNVVNQVRGKVEVGFEDLGAQDIKNIPEPVQVFKLLLDSSATGQVAVAVPAATRSRRRPVIAGALALLAIAAAIVLWRQPWAPHEEPASVAAMAFPLPDKPSIAVLPFNNMSDDTNQDYFADGMTEDLITDLSKVSGLFVIARNSSFSYKGQQVKVRQVAEELGVRYVLEGSVRRAGDQVRINAQLIDATTGGHLWAERYDGSMDDVFDLQDQVTEQIVAALAVSLTGEEQAQHARHDTEDAAAHDAYLQGWARYKLLTPETLAEAVPFFEEALRLDPAYAQAHAALASLYWDVLQNDWAFDLDMPSSRAESRANEHLEEALKAPTPLTHVLQSRMFASLGFPGEAIVEAEKAVALDGNDAAALSGLASALVLAGRPAEGLDFIKQAMRLDPHHPPSYLITLGAAQFGVERYEESAVTFERAVKRNPDNELPRIYLASSYGHLGRIKDADNAIEDANDIRAELGMGDLTLEKKTQFFTETPFQGEIDFPRFGEKLAQERVRAGLSDIPALTWQYRVTTHAVLGLGNTWYEVEGATRIDIHTAKSLRDLGVVFIDTSRPDLWKEQHIPDAINLTYVRSRDSAQAKFSEDKLIAVADKTEEIVVYCSDCHPIVWDAAKAANWGYQKVYFFRGGAQAWKEAGYPVETGE
jgi:TolB-like protein/class 3 adenylate cyclase/rhodanese-related sulfurtransferase/Flp pilus assembly protein TadD